MKIALLLLVFCASVYAQNFRQQFGNNRQNRNNRLNFNQNNRLNSQKLQGNQFNRRIPNQNTIQSSSSTVDLSEGSSDYHFSWRHRGRHAKWDWNGAVAYCKGLEGGRGRWGPISINTRRENSMVSNIIRREKLSYIWTGGERSGNGWRWPRGEFRNVGAWSASGGKGKRFPQPDNREGREDCLAVLNNFYKDGIVWHDIGCHHVKPIICERSSF